MQGNAVGAVSTINNFTYLYHRFLLAPGFDLVPENKHMVDRSTTNCATPAPEAIAQKV